MLAFPAYIFTDDLVLFGEAIKSQASVMRKYLELFCSMSRQRVNFQKLCVYVFPNVTKAIARELAYACGLPLTDCFGKYLEVPVIHERVSKHTYANLVDKVCKRLAAWKSCTLNMAGCLTLIKSITSVLPVYTMQTDKLAVSICDTLDRLNWNFLWGGHENKSKVHMVDWDTVCLSKDSGGLGVRKNKTNERSSSCEISLEGSFRL